MALATIGAALPNRLHGGEFYAYSCLIRAREKHRSPSY